MTTQAKIDSIPVSLPFAADLTTKLFRFGKFTATGVDVCSVAGERANGVIGAMYKQAGIVAGDAGDFYVDRIPIVEASGVINVNDKLATDANGKAKVAAAGDVCLGFALDAATADKQYIRFRPPFALDPSAGNVADSNLAPGSLVVHVKDIADAATADYDLVITDKIEVIDFNAQKRGGAGGAANTVQLKNAANAITDALSINIADKTLAKATTVDDAFSTVAAGGTLRFAVVKAGGNAACFVTVIGIKRA